MTDPGSKLRERAAALRRFVEAIPLEDDDDKMCRAALLKMAERYEISAERRSAEGGIVIRSTNTIGTLHCNFCGKSQHEIHKLIAGPNVFACDECVFLLASIIATDDRAWFDEKMKEALDISGQDSDAPPKA